ncbi:hypothetical protein WMY93_022477 [Mugilogobius chulae]|uniref:Sema domain-containing protein n=1 Tax=Mugilogobius chulae TaxID=88201 RepID=A0AAW0N727_9GOBI
MCSSGLAALTTFGLMVALCCSQSMSQPEVKKTEEDCTRRSTRSSRTEFSHPGAKDFSQLAVDLSRGQIIVGARNFLFRLNLTNISLIQAADWAPDEETKQSCQSKGKTEDECQNYVRVLLLSGSTLFTCGTNAFTPVCMSRQISNISEVLDSINGVARCPYDPRHNSTAMMTARGELYAATVIDFSGRDPVLYRSLGNMPPLRSAQYNSKWLNEPNFVSVYEIGRFAYFFLRETAVENDCGKTVFSRVARVVRMTWEDARLNCSRSGEIPFYFNELQSTSTCRARPDLRHLHHQRVSPVCQSKYKCKHLHLDINIIFLCLFSNSLSASAICAFNLSSITTAFNGPFRFQENPRTAWQPTPTPSPTSGNKAQLSGELHFIIILPSCLCLSQCGTLDELGPGQNLTERSLQDAQRLFLMNDVVQPITVNPLLTQDNVRLSCLCVDVVQGRDRLYHVMYIGTEFGTILKALSTTDKRLQGCLPGRAQAPPTRPERTNQEPPSAAE